MAYPPGGTFFDNKRSFAEVPVDESKDNAIGTSEFLEAAEALIGLFDVLGSVAFNPVKSDMGGNIKVRRPQPESMQRMCESVLLICVCCIENKRPTTNHAPRLANAPNARQNRTRHAKAHRSRGPAMAESWSGFYVAGSAEEPQLPL